MTSSDFAKTRPKAQHTRTMYRLTSTIGSHQLGSGASLVNCKNDRGQGQHGSVEESNWSCQQPKCSHVQLTEATQYSPVASAVSRSKTEI